jgi:hypothetical protein
VGANLEAARSGHPYKSSDGCVPERTKATREGCEAFRKLGGELETGRAASGLEQAAAAIRARLATGAAVQTADLGATDGHGRDPLLYVLEVRLSVTYADVLCSQDTFPCRDWNGIAPVTRCVTICQRANRHQRAAPPR